MDTITAQVSLYPLRQESIGPAIREAVRVFRQRGLNTCVGEMSTLVWGEEHAIFDALREVFHQAAERGDTVMTATFSNACPEPSRGAVRHSRSREVTFDGDITAHYEAWYETLEGRRADALEKASLRRLLGNFPYAQSALEVGCGTGHFTRWLGEQGLMAVGLDLSAGMVEQAQTLDGVLLTQGDARRLPFVDRAFDLVALITTLEFLEQPREALVDALRVARRGVLLGVLNRWSLLGLQRRLAGLSRASVYSAAHFYGVGELRRLLRSVADGKAHIRWHTTLFPRGWPWLQSTLLWGGFIGMAMRLPEGQRQ
jgi:SAM-dependent methyltransferase/uncharacterized protein YqgV (UPF0045/DUF77 family)